MKSTQSIKNPKILNIESEIISKIKHGLRNKEIAEFIKGKVGISYRQAKRYAKLYKEYHGTQYNSSTHSIFPQPSQVKDFFGGGFIEGTIEDTADSSIKTLDGLLDACSVDKKVWSVTDYTITKDDKTNKDGTVTPKFRIRAALEKNKEVEIKSLLDSFKEEAEKHSPKTFEYQPLTKNGRLLEISIFDIHLARLSWGLETLFSDYDTKIAIETYNKALDHLMKYAQDEKITKILLPVGNDLFNSDNLFGTTTAGTEQATSEDSRWQKVFNAGCQMMSDAITRLSSKFEVDVVMVGGNHDYQRCFYLGAYLSAFFRNNNRVNVNNGPSQRKYYNFGHNLILFSHGDKEGKPSNYPILMATEQPKLWSECYSRHVHLGHFHTSQMIEDHGVQIKFIGSLCPPDEWHASKGFVGNTRSAEAFLYDKDEGLVANYIYNIFPRQ